MVCLFAYLLTRSFELVELDEIVAAKWEQGWLRLNVSQAFKQWIREPDSNFGLVLDVKYVETGENSMKTNFIL